MAMHVVDSSARQVAVTSSSAATAVPNAGNYYKLFLNNNSSSNVHYRLGASGATAVAFSGGAGDPFIAPNSQRELWMKGHTHIALVTLSGTATVEFFTFIEKY